MDFLLFEEKIYYSIDNKKGALPKSEIRSLFSGKPKELCVALTDTIQKVTAAPDSNPEKRDEMIIKSFSEDFIIQSENIDKNLYQVIGIEKQKVKEVYALLEKEKVKLLLPYGLALRAFLNKCNFSVKDKAVVFLDDIDDALLLTIFNGAAFTSPRRLALDPQRVIAELQRSENKFKDRGKERTRETNFFIVSNNKEVLDAIIVQNIHPQEDTAYVEDYLPAFSGMSAAKFDMHFLLPEQVVKQRRAREIKKNLALLVMALIILAAGLSLFLFSAGRRANLEARLKESLAAKADNEGKLKRLYREKYQSIVIGAKKVNASYLLSLFLQNIPGSYSVDFIELKKQGGEWILEAKVFLEDSRKFFIPLAWEGVLKAARTENITVNKKPGQRIYLELDPQIQGGGADVFQW